MPCYIVTLTNDEIQELKALVQKGGKGYRIKHAKILLKLDQKPENKAWIYDCICDAYGTFHAAISHWNRDPMAKAVPLPALWTPIIRMTHSTPSPKQLKTRCVRLPKPTKSPFVSSSKALRQMVSVKIWAGYVTRKTQR